MKILNDLDLHVVGLAGMLALPALIASPTDSGILLGKIFLALMLVIPQGRIFTKSGNYSADKSRQKNFLLLHEFILLGIALIVFGVWELESLFGIRQ
jgi:hypothetical protein